MREAARRPGGPRRGRRAVTVAAAAVLAAATPGLAGCVAEARVVVPIRVSTAYVPVPQTPGTTVAYVVIRNNGPADRLVSARTSAGGRVLFQVAQGPNAAGAHTVPSVRIPANGTLAMVPDGVHMVLTGVSRLRGGRDVTLTLVFARAGPVSVVAQVTNPASGGSSYFLNG